MKTNIISTQKYTGTNYPESGIAFNTDENNIEEVFFVIRETNLSMYLGAYVSVKHIPFIKELYESKSVGENPVSIESNTSTISEDFALKVIALNKEKFKEL